MGRRKLTAKEKKQREKAILSIRITDKLKQEFITVMKLKQKIERRNKVKKTKYSEVLAVLVSDFVEKNNPKLLKETLDSMLLKEKADKLARRVENIVKFDLLSEKSKE